MWRWIAIATGGALICTIGDHLHATHGVLGYPQVYAWSQAWWVPLLFFCGTLLALAGSRMCRTIFKAPPIAPNDTRLVAADAIAFAAAYALTSFTHAAPNETMLILVAFWVARILMMPTPKWIIAFSLLSAVVGPLTEAIISACGLFAYAHPDFVGVARWLPGIYLFVAPVSARFEALLSEGDHERA
ncbi:MAG: hypothetical protein ABI421_09210 [Polyangiaceae bacterium]